VCVCNIALVIGHAKCMRRIMLSSVVCVAVPYFPTVYHERYGLRVGGRFIERKMCVLIFSTAFVFHFFQSKNSSKYAGLHVTHPLILTDFNPIILSTDIRKIFIC
jgi:hypothetical protein